MKKSAAKPTKRAIVAENQAHQWPQRIPKERRPETQQGVKMEAKFVGLFHGYGY